MAMSREEMDAQFKGSLETREIELPGRFKGRSIRVRELSGDEVDSYQQSNLMRGPQGEMVPNMANSTARLVVRGLCDEQGNRQYANDDADAVGQWPASVLAAAAKAIQDLSGMSEAAVEEARGNSDAAPSGANTSVSPVTTAS